MVKVGWWTGSTPPATGLRPRPNPARGIGPRPSPVPGRLPAHGSPPTTLRLPDREPLSGNAEVFRLLVDGIETSLGKRARPNAHDEPGDMVAAEPPNSPKIAPTLVLSIPKVPIRA